MIKLLEIKYTLNILPTAPNNASECSKDSF